MSRRSPAGSSIKEGSPESNDANTPIAQHDGYRWTALSVTTVGALLALQMEGRQGHNEQIVFVLTSRAQTGR